MQFKLSTLVALLAVAAPALANNAVVDGLKWISQEAAKLEDTTRNMNFISVAQKGPQVIEGYKQEVKDKATLINSMPSSLPSDAQRDVCDSWATYSENQKHLLSALIYKTEMFRAMGMADSVLQLLHADESANDQYTFDLFNLASSCSGGLEKMRNELSDAYSEAVRVYTA